MTRDVDRPVRLAFRLDDRGPGHTRVSVFVGRRIGSRGHAGQIVLRTDEWDELVDRLGQSVSDWSPGDLVEVAVVPPGWIDEVVLALEAATDIGQRSWRDGDHLNYTNQDRLAAEGRRINARSDNMGADHD